MIRPGGAIGPMNPARGVDPISTRPLIGPMNPTRPGLDIPSNRLMGTFKKGGKVKKTGKYMLHKGEKVVSKKMQKAKPMKEALEAAMGER